MQEGGATLLCITLISLSLSSNTLPNTELGLSLSLTEGMLATASLTPSGQYLSYFVGIFSFLFYSFTSGGGTPFSFWVKGY